MQSLAYGSACGGKEQESCGVPTTWTHPRHLLGWAGAQLAEAGTCLVECPPLDMDGSGYGWLWGWDKGFKILPVHIHCWGRSAKLCAELPHSGKGLNAPAVKSWGSSDTNTSKKELKNKHLPEGARSKGRADYIWISGVCSNLKLTILSYLWEGLVYIVVSPSLSFVV